MSMHMNIYESGNYKKIPYKDMLNLHLATEYWYWSLDQAVESTQVTIQHSASVIQYYNCYTHTHTSAVQFDFVQTGIMYSWHVDWKPREIWRNPTALFKKYQRLLYVPMHPWWFQHNIHAYIQKRWFANLLYSKVPNITYTTCTSTPILVDGN